MSSRDKKPSKPSSSRTNSGRIRTLSDLNRPSASDDSDSESDAPQEYYTGGEKSVFKLTIRSKTTKDELLYSLGDWSGMLVQGPTKHDDVEAIFDRARQMGAMQAPLENLQPSSSSRSFTGTGRLLSGDTVPSVAQLPQQPEAVIHNIVFWRNGFTVNDGPLRRLDDPENAPFLESIKKSECPKELEPADRRSSVHVNLTRKEENFTMQEPERRQVAFQGVGRTLGGNSSTPADSVPAVATPLSTAPSPSMGLVVDKSSPSTSIQLRLADGTRMVAHFNLNHTVSDIRNFLDASRPGADRTYQLQTVGFPPKVLTDPTQTIEQAGLANSVIVQKK